MIEEFLDMTNSVGLSLLSSVLSIPLTKKVREMEFLNRQTHSKLRAATEQELKDILKKLREFLPEEEVGDFDKGMQDFSKLRLKNKNIFLVLEKIDPKGIKNKEVIGYSIVYPLLKSAEGKLKRPDSNFSNIDSKDLYTAPLKKCNLFYIGFMWAPEKQQHRGSLMIETIRYIIENERKHITVYARPTSDESLRFMRNHDFREIGKLDKKPRLEHLSKITIETNHKKLLI